MTADHREVEDPDASIRPDTTVCWHAVGTDGDAALRSHAARVVGVRPDEISVGRLCGRCGSAAHGRPWASHGVHVSLSRSGPHLVTAVSTSGPVGVDVQEVVAAGRALRDMSGSFSPGAVPDDDEAAARAWCRAEAVLKREGTGLSTWPGSAPAVDDGAVDLEAPDGYCAAVAVGDR